MIKYGLKNIGLNYLSCHTQVHIGESELYLYNYVNNTNAVIRGKNEINLKLLDLLAEGISDENLIEYLKENYGLKEDDYYYLLQKGLLE